MKREFLDYIEDIYDAMTKVEAFIEGMDYRRFAADAKTAFAIPRALEIIGEAVKKVPRSVRNQYQDIPWKDMADMRDVLIHEYWGVNLKTIWKTAKHDIPSLKPYLCYNLTGFRREVMSFSNAKGCASSGVTDCEAGRRANLQLWNL